MNGTVTIETACASSGIRMKKEEESRLSLMLDLLNIDVEPVVTRTVNPENEDSPCSRNVRRKQRNWERRLAAKKSRRKEEKLRRKERRAEQSGTNTATPQHNKRAVRAMINERLAGARETGPKLCVDLSMTDCMSHKEVSRLAGQIRRLYGSNRRAAQPFHLFLTDLREDSPLYLECQRMNDGFFNYVIDITEESCLDLFPLESVVYLTPDAEQALECVDPEKVYILGGLVDESIQKKISFRRATGDGVCCARLPIDEYMVKKTNAKNFHSKILSINQVFDILLGFCDTGSWTNALGQGFPLGKGYMVPPEAVPEMQC